MTSLKIGACLATFEILENRDWLFEANRDIEFQGFSTHKDLTVELEERIASAKEALRGFDGRLRMHGPYEGLYGDPPSRRATVHSFDTDSIALSIETGHAHLARLMSGAPPVDYFLRDAGDQLRHIHLQDLDGYVDWHWTPGEGEIHWQEVFHALSECTSDPQFVLKLRRISDIPQGFSCSE